MAIVNKNCTSEKIFIGIQEFLVLAGCFFYLFFFVHPLLMLEALPPVFLTDANFFGEFLKIPGGVTDWASAFVQQFWFSNFLAALFLTICFWLVALLTKAWVAMQIETRPIYTLHLIPACLLLILYSQYYFPLSILLALIVNLSALNCFLRWAPEQQVPRAAIGLVLSIFLFWITGGAFFVFVVLLGINDLFQKRIAHGLVQILVMPVLPYAASATVFLITFKEAYCHNLFYESVTNFWLNSFILPVFFLFLLIILLVSKISVVRTWFKKISAIAMVWKLTAGFLLLVGGTFLFGQKSYNKTAYILLQIDRDVKESKWRAVLDLTPQWPTMNPLFISQTNLAFYKSGLLLDRMFAYPQPLGTLGLLMNFDWCSACPEETGNLYWMLGLVSECQHWTHEAFEQKGCTPAILKRLGIIYMLKGDNEAAEKYFLNLKNVPFEKETAEHLLRLNANPSELASDPEFSDIRACMPVEDVSLTGNPSLRQLEILLKRNPQNKMAFEYMIAYNLLDGNVAAIANDLPDFRTLGYAQIPMHVQEALLVFAAQTPTFDKNQLRNMIQQRTYDRFVGFQQVMLKYQGHKNSAKQELYDQYGDTYWYYLVYAKPAKRLPENQNGHQH
ncbi:MAG TPA: DUF6057 family protein [Bacteroidota bacterium]|nr:DUF6057 family protein [Bacteroidota bacterium]